MATRQEIVDMHLRKTHFLVWSLTPNQVAFITKKDIVLYKLGTNQTAQAFAEEKAKEVGLPAFVVQGNLGIGLAAYEDGRETFKCNKCSEDHKTDDTVSMALAMRALERLVKELELLSQGSEQGSGMDFKTPGSDYVN